ncbi:hypothetical protein L596_007035 [Steinernema carpocapsae]|uniref:Uncharacterized protein n=1 Tax=Steinernema carpocapsae TaxID=34508 RepID=A0A4U5P829_STECR|nr:hypothetical protein L596_007035 [Steinernema carpocapsae]
MVDPMASATTRRTYSDEPSTSLSSATTSREAMSLEADGGEGAHNQLPGQSIFPNLPTPVNGRIKTYGTAHRSFSRPYSAKTVFFYKEGDEHFASALEFDCSGGQCCSNPAFVGQLISRPSENRLFTAHVLCLATEFVQLWVFIFVCSPHNHVGWAYKEILGYDES